MQYWESYKGEHQFTNGFDLWQADGTSYENRKPNRDLIIEWIDKPVTVTLRDLNVQSGVGVGDVVWRGIGTTASPSPVITETVTTQRIVPGVYGRVSIAGSSQTSVELEFVGEYGATGRSRLSQAELTAAIETLAQIRDALTHNSAK